MNPSKNIRLRAWLAPAVSLACMAIGALSPLPAAAQETKKMEDTVPIGERLTRDGRVAVYGIFFDSEKASIKAESSPVIAEIAEILNKSPDMEIAIVGHTDATGPHEHNLDLSKMRANAVVNAIVNNHGIKRARLYPAGAGFLQPVAPNNTEEGRALNRRVELIQMKSITGDAAPNRVVEDAKKMLKAMSDYLASQNAISFSYDAVLEVVTTEDQKLALASSGDVTLNRPDKLRATRSGGFADFEMVFDGEALTIAGKNVNRFTKIPVPGSIDNLMEVMHTVYDRPLPAADLLSSDAYGQLTGNITDVKDLGSGVINGVECDHLAFRTEGTDWQIWIAQGNQPYPCKYVIASKTMERQPQYSISIREWKTGWQVGSDDFAFTNATNAEQIAPEEIKDKLSELPANFQAGAAAAGDGVVTGAKDILKKMSDYMAAQGAISFGFDAVLEVVTTEEQKLSLASSGSVTLNRPDKIHVTRSGGFADVEMIFDGDTMTLAGKNANLFTQFKIPGSLDNLFDEMRTKYDRPLPAADLLSGNSYEKLVMDVTDVKDLGSGVINGVECDYLAFRTEDVDWQIWVAQGDRPYPCKYVVTSKAVDRQPQYSISVRDWKTGNDAMASEFAFKNTTNAMQIDPADLKAKMSELPANFKQGN